MSITVFVLCVTLAIARAGYLQPTLRYAHDTPLAIQVPAPTPLTYPIPPTVKAEPLPPVVATSYGYSTAHTPIPAPIIRAEPLHGASAFHAVSSPLAIAAHTASIARVPSQALTSAAFTVPTFHAAPAPFTFAAPAIHATPIPRVAFAAPAVHAAPAPLALGASTLGFSAHFGGSHLGLGYNYAAGFEFANPSPISFAGQFGPAPLAPSSYENYF